jgi:Transposase
LRGYRNAIRDQLPDTVTVLDAFHVAKPAGNTLHEIRRRVQQATLGRRGHKDDPLYQVRRTLLTGVEHLTDRQRARLDKWLPLGNPNGEVEVTWHVYQQAPAIYTVTSPLTPTRWGKARRSRPRQRLGLAASGRPSVRRERDPYPYLCYVLPSRSGHRVQAGALAAGALD